MKNLSLVIIFILCTTFKTFNCNLSTDFDTTTPSSFYCPDRKPQYRISMTELMGMWYGNEIITHQDDYDNRTGTFYYDTCVVIHLADITDQMKTTTHNPHSHTVYYTKTPPEQNTEIRYLRLIWDETNANVEYLLRYNSTKPGFWIASAPQTGTILDLNLIYRQFYGTVQVMKAVKNQLVLTFCKNMPESQQYSLILSRRPNSLSNEDLRSIRELLKRRQLHSLSVRKVCTYNGVTRKDIPSLLIFLLINVLFVKLY